MKTFITPVKCSLIWNFHENDGIMRSRVCGGYQAEVYSKTLKVYNYLGQIIAETRVANLGAGRKLAAKIIGEQLMARAK